MARAKRPGTPGEAPKAPPPKPSDAPAASSAAAPRRKPRATASPKAPDPVEETAISAPPPAPEPTPSPPAAWPDRRSSYVSEDRTRTASIAIIVGCAVIAVALVAFMIVQPSLPTSPASAPARPPRGQVSCSPAPDQSFNAPANIPPTVFTLDAPRACLNGRTPYEKTPAGYFRVIPNAAASLVTSLEISAGRAMLQRKDYALSPADFAQLRAAIGSTATFRCGPADTPAMTAGEQARLAAIHAAAGPYLARQPTAQVTWRCAPAD